MRLFKGLQSMELGELEFRHLGTWPITFRLLIYSLAFIGFLIFGYMVRLSDLQNQLNLADEHEEILKEQLLAKAHQATYLASYVEQVEALELTFTSVLQRLPKDAEVATLLDAITKIEPIQGLEFLEIKLQPEIEQDFYIELPIQVKVLGRYHDLATFIGHVTEMSRLVTVHDFSIVPPEDVMSARLVMNVLLKTYRYQEQGL